MVMKLFQGFQGLNNATKAGNKMFSSILKDIVLS